MADRRKRVVVLGSTGSIGHNTLDVIARFPDRLELLGLGARSRTDILARQIAQYHPPLVAVWEDEKARALAHACGGREVFSGIDGLTRLATHPDAEIVVVATSGRDALIPLIRAIQAGKQIALASKELLVMAGSLIMRLVQEHDTTLIPIDSEHAALFQCLQGVSKAQVERLVITGSGGPLRTVPAEAMQTVTREQVLAHPKWQMGQKITVDSATLMNKGLEVIEARWLFDLPIERFRVVIHPEAVVHAIIELVDGASLAQISPCDMRLPIQYALSFPERWENTLPRLQLTEAGALQFFEPNLDQFPCLRLALEVAAEGGSLCVALNGANDVAVQTYLEGHLPFADIPHVIAETLAQHTTVDAPTLDDILAVDAWSRSTTHDRILQWSPR